ncbi:lysine exporter LysO family protein [Anaerophilus nitritogenes]|uniref:lysine exporter LysO family protein n=1 Tax=Anaerophilus nitritogenes TaxID=2498136 RepID=UPI00101C6294|nr:lysine exporter LysO family protein [Anaerophilus nitritogenes]
MTWFPFISLGIGLLIGIQKLSQKYLLIVDKIINTTLVVLMFVIGASIGIDSQVMQKLGIVGFNCTVLALLALSFSVLFVFFIEKTILPLEKIQKKLLIDQLSLNDEVDISQEESQETLNLVWIMPVSILTGILVGFLIFPQNSEYVLSIVLTVSLMILYIGVGISLGTNKKVFRYVKMLGWKIIFLPIAIFLGSILGGVIGGMFLKVPYSIAVISVSGMSYYSITGAFMTSVYGIEGGTYGFIVNVMREFFTVLMLPFLIRISKGSPIAGGAAGNMDTMLAPITKFVGVELGLVTLITGTILTFSVPFILPVLYRIFL